MALTCHDESESDSESESGKESWIRIWIDSFQNMYNIKKEENNF